MKSKKTPQRVRYAVVGLGYISQSAVLPAFKNARKNCELAALVSADAKKLTTLGKRYGVKNLFSYNEYETCLKSGEIDAVYIALPNHLHKEFTVAAAQAGIHVLCEKPLATNEDDAREMVRACEDNGVYLMTAYRLHFEKANLEAIKTVNSGRIGEPRFFYSTFSMQVKAGNIRLQGEKGGGPLLDLGIYCVNASRYLFQSEPLELVAVSASHGDRFEEVDEMVSAILKFPGDRLASFTCSFGASDTSHYGVVGTKGVLWVDKAFEIADNMTHHLRVGEKTFKRKFLKRDQFAPELIYFSRCVLNGKKPEASGEEGVADLRVLDAIERSLHTGRLEKIVPMRKVERPTPNQEIHRPPIEQPKLVHAEKPAA